MSDGTLHPTHGHRLLATRPRTRRSGAMAALLAVALLLPLATACVGGEPEPATPLCSDCSMEPLQGSTPAEAVIDERGDVRINPTPLLGRSLEDPVAVAYLSGNRCQPANNHWGCATASTEISVDGYNRIDAVVFDAPGLETSGYAGELPVGITFTDSPDVLVEKLGQPVAGRAAPSGFLKWVNSDGDVGFFVNFLPAAPLRISNVQLALQD